MKILAGVHSDAGSLHRHADARPTDVARTPRTSVHWS